MDQMRMKTLEDLLNSPWLRQMKHLRARASRRQRRDHRPLPPDGYSEPTPCSRAVEALSADVPVAELARGFSTDRRLPWSPDCRGIRTLGRLLTYIRLASGRGCPHRPVLARCASCALPGRARSPSACCARRGGRPSRSPFCFPNLSFEFKASSRAGARLT